MRCLYDDGLRVSFAGPLRISKGDEINVCLEPEEIPEDMRGELLEAALHESCSDLRNIARAVTDTFGTNLPEEWGVPAAQYELP